MTHAPAIRFAALCLLLPACSAPSPIWRTGYFLQAEAGEQDAWSIPWSKYTHVVHYAVKPAYANGACTFDTSYGINGANITDFVSAAREAGVKALICILEDEGADAIRTCTDPYRIEQFVALISDFVAAHKYDGVDIDWEHRVVGRQYQDLITRLRAAMPTAVLTTAVTVTERHITAAVQDKLDQINLMAYDLDFSDLTGATINYTWYIAPTFQGINVRNNAIDILPWYYVAVARNAPSKIGIGVPFYGRIKRGCLDYSGTAGVTDPNQTWVGPGSRGAIQYRELVNSDYWKSGTLIWDERHKSQYIRYKGGNCSTDAFIPYTGPEQLRAVVDLIKANKYGGIMTYALPYEYLPGEEGDARYPLSSAIFEAVNGQ